MTRHMKSTTELSCSMHHWCSPQVAGSSSRARSHPSPVCRHQGPAAHPARLPLPGWHLARHLQGPLPAGPAGHTLLRFRGTLRRGADAAGELVEPGLMVAVPHESAATATAAGANASVCSYCCCCCWPLLVHALGRSPHSFLLTSVSTCLHMSSGPPADCLPPAGA